MSMGVFSYLTSDRYSDFGPKGRIVMNQTEQSKTTNARVKNLDFSRSIINQLEGMQDEAYEKLMVFSECVQYQIRRILSDDNDSDKEIISYSDALKELALAVHHLVLAGSCVQSSVDELVKNAHRGS